MNTLLKMTVFLLVSNQAIAGYVMHVPLEIKNLGALPDGSIVFGNGSDNTTTPTNPTEPEPTNCSYSMTSPLSVYVEGYLSGNYMKQAFYLGKEVTNGKKGTVHFTSEGIDYADICFGNESPIYKVDSNDDPNWEADDCRYNLYDAGAIYYWQEVAGQDIYADRLAFRAAALGTLPTITYQSSGVIFPAGYINTTYGQIQPVDNTRIVRGNFSFSRGNFRETSGGVYYYDVCKTTLK